MNFKEESIIKHAEWRGKFEIRVKTPLEDPEDLSLAYTPGVAGPCLRIADNKEDVYKYTIKSNSVAVVTDGSAVLGLGNIGAEASLPVMEGKAALFKKFANIDAFPIALSTQDITKTIETVRNIAPVFGGINLEDIKAPECFVIEEALQDIGIPVMHDDQHGTAVVVLAGLINALKVTGKKKDLVRIVVNGAGSAGIAITKLLIKYGFDFYQLMVCDKDGILYHGRDDVMINKYQKQIARETNKTKKSGLLKDALKDADIFIGVSAANILSEEMIRNMADDPIIVALANPDPEIMPDKAKDAGASIVATGRSDFPNQINNVLVFPGMFRGALDASATKITDYMKIAAAEALASLIESPTPDEILPYATDERVVPLIAEAVVNAWEEYGDSILHYFRP